MAKESANNGFIKIDRSILDWQHFGEPTVVVVFLYLLLKANHKNGWWQGLQCERGATFVGLRAIKEDTKLAINTVRSAISKLVESGEIKRIQVDRHHTKTIITKYAQYQDFSFGSVSKNDTLTDTLTDTKQERKERKELVVDDKKHTHTHEELIKDLFSRQITIEAFCKNEGITTDQCRKYAEAVVIEWQLTDENHNNRTQAIKHLLAQIRIKAQADRERGITFTDKSVRLQPMIDFCRELIADGFDRQFVKDWYGYWTEECQDRTGRMRFEAEKTWNAKRRFNNYLKRKAQ